MNGAPVYTHWIDPFSMIFISSLLEYIPLALLKSNLFRVILLGTCFQNINYPLFIGIIKIVKSIYKKS